MEFKELSEVKIEDVISCVGSAIEESRMAGIINPMLFDVFLKVNYILTFSDVEVSEEELQNKLALYDRFNAEGLINEELYKTTSFRYVCDHADEWEWKISKHEESFAGALESLAEFAELLGVNLQQSADNLSKIDLSNLPQLLELAERLGNN